MTGIAGTAVALVAGTLHGAKPGCAEGRAGRIMMRPVDIPTRSPYMFGLILLLVAFR